MQAGLGQIVRSMPELPEVEIARRNLSRWLSRKAVVSAEAEPVRTFRGATPKEFEALSGKVKRVDRKGKYLLVAFQDGRGFLAHLGMTGKWVRRPAGKFEPYSRARLLLNSGEVVHFRDPRLFGRIEPAPANALWNLPAIRQLGKDAFDGGLSAAELKEAIAGSKQSIKVALMDQARLAGLGNIHAAEALFRARIHPGRKVSSLSEEEWKRLAKAIAETLKFALDQQEGEEIDYVEEPGTENPFLIYGRAGEKCGRCKTKVKSFVQQGRTTHYCPRCQPLKPVRGL